MALDKPKSADRDFNSVGWQKWFFDVYRAILGSSVLPGTTIMWAGATAPAGYLAYALVPTTGSRITYAALYKAIGTTWGAGDGSTTFGLPYAPAGYALVVGTTGVVTHGKVKDHAHTAVSNVQNSAQAGVGALTGSAPVNTSTPVAPEGGADNLAAGIGILYCVKI